MAVTLNASSTAGFVTTADTSTILQLQTNGTTAVTVDDSQRVAFVAGTAALPAITTTGDTNTGIFFPAADTIAFSEGGVEAMRLNSAGNLQTIGTISVGNATPSTSGAGITFPATQSASSDANTLDDYEEGTIAENSLGLAYGTAGTSSFNYSDRKGTYTKIGRVVYFTIDIRLASFSKGTASGELFIVGLPFAQRNTSGYDGARCTVQLYNWTYTTSPLSAVVMSDTTTIGISRMVSNDVTVVINDPSGNSIIWVTGFYFV